MQERSITTCKYIIIGDQACGKSCLLHRFTDGNFIEGHNVTIGVEFGTKTVQKGGQSFRIQAWDTAGQEAFRSITRNFYRGAAAALLVYDVTRRETFNHAESWLKECRVSCKNENIVIVLVANKVDDTIRRKVSRRQGEEFARDHDLLYEEVSAKGNLNVQQLFERPLGKIAELISAGTIRPKSAKKTGVALQLQPEKKGPCCL